MSLHLPMHQRQKFTLRLLCLSVALFGALSVIGVGGNVARAATTFKTGDNTTTGHQCGSGKNAVYVSIDLGCKGKSCTSTNTNGCNALTDAVFAIIRFLSLGVGFVVVASLVWAGIQYTTARDDPKQVSMAKARIFKTTGALLVYIFAYAILNYVIPGAFFK